MITSNANPKMKEIVQFQKKSRARNEAGVFIAEGIRMVREIPPERLVRLYVTEAFYERHRQELPGGGVSAELVSPQVFSCISDTKNPQGVLAVVRQKETTEERLLGLQASYLPEAAKLSEEKCLSVHSADKSASLQYPIHVLLLDNLQDPGNVGTIFRTAEAAGVTGIFLSRGCADIYNPKTVRSTMGALFRMPFTYVEDMPKTVERLKRQGAHVYAAHLDGERFYDQEDYGGHTAFLIGNEGNGLRPEVAECADSRIRIPMLGQAESLNAAVAASVLMFEVSRQRRRLYSFST